MSVINAKLISSLEKIYPEDVIPEKGIKCFSMLKNEKKSFQAAIESDDECEINLAVEGDLKNIVLYTVEDVKSDLPMSEDKADDYYRFSKSGYYPDLLLPIKDRLHLKKGITVLWVEVDAKNNECGKHALNLNIGDKKLDAEIEIIDAELDFRDFVYTNWFHTDCLMSYYNFEAFSDEYWTVTENYLKTANEYGMNCVLTPIFTPPLDTEVGKERPTVQLVDINYNNGSYSFCFEKLTKWIETAQNCGMEYFELAHFFTQWGARHAPKIMATVNGEYRKLFGWETKSSSREYKDFLKAFSVELKNYVESKGLKEKVLLHVSDEPNFTNIYRYGKASKLIHRLFKGYKIVDALSDYNFYRLGIVSTPIPSTDHIHKFIGNAKELWCYYCSGQRNHFVANRFFCNESLRTRVLGYQLYKFNVRGFLHWGYNFYYTQLSKKLINPYEVSDAGKAFPSGDSYMVYPAPDGTAYHSLRLKVFYDGLQDMAALNTLEKLIGKSACINIIEENGSHNITFRNYPHSNDWLLETREKINESIKNNIT